MKEAARERNWEQQVRSLIIHSDTVLVMVGRQTHRAPGVLREVAIARDAGIPVVQMIGYRDLKNPTPVRGAGRLYRWSWENLKTLLR